MNIIFLDIDGVLHNPWKLPTTLSPSEHIKYFNPEAIKNLDIILDTVENCRIVISSSWRLYGDLDHVRKLFRGFRFVNYIIGSTPFIGPTDRPKEIIQWLQHATINIRNFIVIDDYPLGMNIFKDKYIQTNENRLLDAEAKNKAIDSLLYSTSIININLDECCIL